jgi:hypothetical protein
MPFGEIVGEMVGDDVDSEARALGDLAALPLESGDETEVVQHGGAKEKGHVTDLCDALFSEESDFLEAVGQRDRRLRGIGKSLQIHDQRGEGLANLIVEFTGDGLALLLLSVDQALGELLEFALGVETLQVFLLGAALKAGDIENDRGSKEEAEAKAKNSDNTETMAGLSKIARDFPLGLAQFEFVEITYLPGKGQNDGALIEGQLTQRETVPPMDVGEDDAVSEEPIAVEFINELA